MMAQRMYHGNSKRLRGVHNFFEHLRGKTPLGRLGCRWKNNIKVGICGIDFEAVD
jgi:hypothetical protein